MEAAEAQPTVPLRRHYSSIGIEDVFLDFPQTSLPKSYGHGGSCWLSDEIVFTLKAQPEDFLVREVSPRRWSLPNDLRVADLKEMTETMPLSSDEQKKEVANQETSQNHSDDGVEGTMEPKTIIKRILDHHFPKHSEKIQADIYNLNEKVLESVEDGGRVKPEDEMWIKTIPSDESCLATNREVKDGGDRGSFHRAMKLVFPLLQSATVSRRASGGGVTNQQIQSWIHVHPDLSFWDIIPRLLYPRNDLPMLHLFRNRGCVMPSSAPKGKKRKHAFITQAKDIGNDGCQVILPLRPTVSKDERREVHRAIAAGHKGFKTGTIKDHVAKPNKQPSATGITTSAIIVDWTNKAVRTAKSKKGSVKSRNTLCVLKKRQKEHLAAIQHLTTALRCPQSNIGLAGIKDMQAITYQFCTIRNQLPDQVAKGNAYLMKRGMELGSFIEVDWLIRQGDLDGNYFAIVLRDMKRVRVNQSNGGTAGETMVDCGRKHFLARVATVRDIGFVNFYGEQRLGMPGESSEVGVRSFEIGRAMLQGNFGKAIDLLMTGRLVCRGDDTVESPQMRKARQIWLDSGGDAKKTLKAIPMGDAMGRERIVLQGLKRYQEAHEALKCLPFGVRTFWINAYQSFVFNKMASERLSRYGKSPVLGDLAQDEEGTVYVVDMKNLASTKFEDVVLTLPGYKVKYPENEMGKLYHDFLEKEDVRFNPDAPVEATAKGSYRKLIVRVDDLSVDEITGKDPDWLDSVRLTFTLPPGSYATMMLREMMFKTTSRN